MKPRPNPLLLPFVSNPVIDAKKLACKMTFENDRQRERWISKYVDKENATTAIEHFSESVDVFGFSKGQFSLIDIIQALLKKTGPADLDISTWTAAKADASDLLDLLRSDEITNLRLLIDLSFARRQPEVAKFVVDNFGNESLRVTQNHAKFFTLHNDQWSVTCKTSMNLNHNPRFEDFDISNNPDLYNFIKSVMDEIWITDKQKKFKDVLLEDFE